MLAEEQQLRSALQTENRQLKAENHLLKQQIQTLQTSVTATPNPTSPNATVRATKVEATSTDEEAAKTTPTARVEAEQPIMQSLNQALAKAKARIAQLGQEKAASASSKAKASFVKANKQKLQNKEKKSRKRRAAQHNGVRRYQLPTEPILEHKLVECQCCQGAVSNYYLSR